MAEEVGLFVPSEAVSVYEVVEAGLTPLEPLLGGATAPTPWLMDVLVQLVVDQESVEELPETTVDGLAVNELMKQADVTVTVAVAVGLFVPSEAESTYVVVETGLTLLLLFTPTTPTPWLMEALVQFEVVQERTDVPPSEMVDGVPVNEDIEHAGVTVTIALATGLFVPSVAMSVYVVVVPGVTPCEPEVTTDPIPWLMEAEVQFVVSQVSVEELPDTTVEGLAVNEVIAQGGTTVTVAAAVGLFVPSVAVSVYVVVVPGVTLLVPEATGVADPTPWLMDALVQFEVVQDRVDDVPNGTDPGEALNAVMVQTGPAVTVTLAVAVALLTPSDAVSVYVIVLAGETLCVPEATGLTTPTP